MRARTVHGLRCLETPCVACRVEYVLARHVNTGRTRRMTEELCSCGDWVEDPRAHAASEVADELTAPVDARWRIWFYKPGTWRGIWPFAIGNAEGCTRTLLIGNRWTGCVVFGLWRMRFSPECSACVRRDEVTR